MCNLTWEPELQESSSVGPDLQTLMNVCPPIRALADIHAAVHMNEEEQMPRVSYLNYLVSETGNVYIKT